MATILKLKAFISERVGVPVERLIVAEEYRSRFFKYYDDTEQASEAIQNNDISYVYELEAKPTNLPSKLTTKKNKFTYGHDSDDEVPSWEDPAAAVMAVPVYHRRASPEGSSRRSATLINAPHFITVTPQEVSGLHQDIQSSWLNVTRPRARILSAARSSRKLQR